MSRRNILEAPSRAPLTASIPLLSSIMKMLSHLSNKNHPSLSRTLTTLLRYRTCSIVSSLYPFINQIIQPKSVYRPSWLSNTIHYLSLPFIPFRNENNVAVLIYPVRNHLTVGTRSSSSSLSNHSFSLWKWYFGLDIPSKKSSRFRNACRAYDWWHHHLISSSRIRYPNNPQKKSSKTPTRWDDIRMTNEKVLNCYHESQHLDVRTRFYHLIFVMKMVCAHECSSRGAFGV